MTGVRMVRLKEGGDVYKLAQGYGRRNSNVRVIVLTQSQRFKLQRSAPVGAPPLFDDLQPSRFHRRPSRCLRPLSTTSILSSNLVIYVWMKICLPPLDSLDGCSDHLSLVRPHLRWIPNYRESRMLEIHNATPPSKIPRHLRLPFLELFDSRACYNLHSSTPFLLLCEILSSRAQVRSSHALSALAFFNGI